MLLGAPQLKLHPGRFGGHRHCSSGEIMVLVCQVIFQVITLPGLVAIGKCDPPTLVAFAKMYLLNKGCSPGFLS